MGCCDRSHYGTQNNSSPCDSGCEYNTKREALQRAARREPAIEVIEKDDDIGIDFIRK
jgi:hypothetical protein